MKIRENVMNRSTPVDKNEKMQKMMAGLRALWSHMNEGPQKDWDRVYLCSMAPMSAEALRENVEAGRSHS